MGRIFKVWLNLDTMGAALVGCDTDQERSRWLSGFQIGAAGAEIRPDWCPHKQHGWTLGHAAYLEATVYHGLQSERGVKSAAARRAKYGSAGIIKNEPDMNAGSTGAQAMAQTTVRTNPTSNIQHPRENIQEGSAEGAPASAKPSSKSTGKARDDSLTRLRAAGAEVFGKQDQAAWKSVVATHGVDTILAGVIDLITAGQRTTLAAVIKTLSSQPSGLSDREIDDMFESSGMGRPQ